MKDPRSLIRPLVRALEPYVPPSRRVLAAIKASVDGRLRLYPNPTAQALRERLAELHGCESENIIVGNGSDELLAMAVRAFADPVSARRESRELRSTVQFFSPSYSLYPVLAQIHGARANAVALKPDFDLPAIGELKRGRKWEFGAALSLVTTPNAPSGRGYGAALCRAQQGVVVLDEAYVDFADGNAMSLALEHRHVLVARTFSKAYSLCFQRVGYFVGAAELIAALQKIRDSYNVNGLGQIAALATLSDLPPYQANFRQIIATREELSGELTALGFEVFPSQTNFILVRPPRFAARSWLHKLRERKILVRWFSSAPVQDYLRITIGTPDEARALVRGARGVLRTKDD
jgi:histidinol-phosphate aminotransferase